MDRRKVTLLICAGLAVIFAGDREALLRFANASSVPPPYDLSSGAVCRLGVCCNVEER